MKRTIIALPAVAASLLLLAASGTSVPPPRILTPGWSAHYAFEKLGPTEPDVSDPSVKGESKHPASRHGGTAIADGASGKAIGLDGKSYLSIPDFPGGRAFTVAAWVRTEAGGRTTYVLSKGNNISGSFYLRLQDGARPRVGFLPMDNMTIFLESRRRVNDGRWHHLAGVLDGRNLMLFIDGRLDLSSPLDMPVTVRLPKYDRFTYIGAFDIAENDGPPDAAYFKGGLDEVRLTNCAVAADIIAGWATRRK